MPTTLSTLPLILSLLLILPCLSSAQQSRASLSAIPITSDDDPSTANDSPNDLPNVVVQDGHQQLAADTDSQDFPMISTDEHRYPDQVEGSGDLVEGIGEADMGQFEDNGDNDEEANGNGNLGVENSNVPNVAERSDGGNLREKVVQASKNDPESNEQIRASLMGSGPKTIVEECQPKLDLVFLLDSSGSIEQIYKEHVRWAVSLVESLPIEQDTVRVAAVQFAGFPLTEFALGTYPSAEDIRQHLQKIDFQSGVTRTGYALRKAEAELFRPDRGARDNAKKVIILFTDGLSIDDPLKPAQQLRDLKHVKIYVVSVSTNAFQVALNRIAGRQENFFGPDELPRLRNALLSEAEKARACLRIGDRRPMVISRSFPRPSPMFVPSGDLNDLHKGGGAQKSNAIDDTDNAIGDGDPVVVALAATRIQNETSPIPVVGLTKSFQNMSGEKLETFGEIFRDSNLTRVEVPNLPDQIVHDGQSDVPSNTTLPLEDLTKDVESTNVEEVANGSQRNDIPSNTTLSLEDLTKDVESTDSTNNEEVANGSQRNGIEENTDNDLPQEPDQEEADASEGPEFSQVEAQPNGDAEDVFEDPNSGEGPRTVATPILTTSSRTTTRSTVTRTPQTTTPKRSTTPIIPITTTKRRASVRVQQSIRQEIVPTRILPLAVLPSSSNEVGRSEFGRSLSLAVAQQTIAVEASKVETRTRRPLSLSPNTTPTRHQTATTPRPTETTTSRRRTTPTGRPFFRRLNSRLSVKDGDACPVDLLFVVDSSGSVHKFYDDQKAYLNDVLSQIKLGPQAHRVALLQFAGNDIQKTEWSYDSFEDSPALMSAFSQMRHLTGTTFIGKALQSALRILETRRHLVPSIVVLLSDGFSQDDAVAPAEELQRLPNIELFALSISELSNADYLGQLTGDRSHVFVGIEAAEALRNILLDRLHCQRN